MYHPRYSTAAWSVLLTCGFVSDSLGQVFATQGTGGGLGVLVRSGNPALGEWGTTFTASAFAGSGGLTVANGGYRGGVHELIVGSTGGVTGSVGVINSATGEVLRQFTPYGGGYSGAIHVASGDVNGDGSMDIIVGTGAGFGPQVRAFDGLTGSVLASFFAYDVGFQGGVRVAAADLNGDGRAEIVTGAGPGAGPHVKAFNGQDLSEMASFFAFNPGFLGGVNVAAGDLRGNQVIVVGADAGGAPQVSLFGLDGTQQGSFFGLEAASTVGVRVGLGDSNGDGLTEVLVASGPGRVSGVWALDPNGLTVNGQIPFAGAYDGGLYVAGGVTPVPEPAFAASLAGLLALGFGGIRRRLQAPR